MQHSLPVAPGALIGYTKRGTPIYLLGGGSQPVGDPPVDPPPPSAAPPSAGQPPAAAAAAAEPQEDISTLPDWAQKAIREARAEAGKARTTAKQNAADQARAEVTAQIAKALGLAQDDPVDPAALTAQIEQAQGNAWRSAVELQVYRLAGQHGANPEALLDSLKFVDSLEELVAVDPRSPEFATALATKVQEAVAANPGYKAAGQAPAAPTAPRPDPSQGSRGGTPTPTRGRSLTDAIRAHYGA